MQKCNHPVSFWPSINTDDALLLTGHAEERTPTGTPGWFADIALRAVVTETPTRAGAAVSRTTPFAIPPCSGSVLALRAEHALSGTDAGDRNATVSDHAGEVGPTIASGLAIWTPRPSHLRSSTRPGVACCLPNSFRGSTWIV